MDEKSINNDNKPENITSVEINKNKAEQVVIVNNNENVSLSFAINSLLFRIYRKSPKLSLQILIKQVYSHLSLKLIR